MLDYKKLSSSLVFIFGGSGDLNYRKLNPALFNLFIDEAMPANFDIVGIARSEYIKDEYEEHLQEGIDNFSRRKGTPANRKNFARTLSSLQMDRKDGEEYQKHAKITNQKAKE